MSKDRPATWPILLYNAAIAAGSPLLLAYLGYRLVRGKSRAGCSERWGRLPEAVTNKPGVRAWFHAASVGEVMAALPIVTALRARMPEVEVLLTVITPGGREVAEAHAGKTLDHVCYLPFDLPILVRRAVGQIQPDVFVGVETELWPNLLYTLSRKRVPAALVNARISDRSFPRYRLARWLMRHALACYDRLLAQTPRDMDRLIALGADPERASMAGNVKFDQAGEPLSSTEVHAMKQEFRIQPGAPVWVVGSTRVLEEERMVWAAYHLARASLPGLVLIHAPRHVDRAGAVEEGMRAVGLQPVRRTALGASNVAPAVLILDTFGELGRVYAMADVAFVGNSLVPPGGGQNPLQPLAQGKPVLFGPYVSNFRDVAADAETHGVAFTVRDARDLANRLITLIRDPAERARIGARALDLIRTNRGAADRCAAELQRLLVTAVADSSVAGR